MRSAVVVHQCQRVDADVGVGRLERGDDVAEEPGHVGVVLVQRQPGHAGLPAALESSLGVAGSVAVSHWVRKVVLPKPAGAATRTSLGIEPRPAASRSVSRGLGTS